MPVDGNKRCPRSLASRYTPSTMQGLDGNRREGQRDAGIIFPSWSVEVLNEGVRVWSLALLACQAGTWRFPRSLL